MKHPALRSEGSILTAAVFLFLAINALVFATPFYRGLVAPDSSAGTFDRTLAETDAVARDPATDVLVLGDSRIYNGFDAATAGRAAPPLHFINAGIPGTTPRCWDVFVRALDPNARRFRAIVIPVDTYGDDDSAIGSLDGDDHYGDLHYIVFAASARDIVRIARSFPNADRRYQAFFDLALRGTLLRDDVQDFLADPAARFAALAAPQSVPALARLRVQSLDGLRVDFTHDTLVEPPMFPSSHMDDLRRQLFAIAHPLPAYGAYRREWLGPIVRRYRAAGVPVIFVRIPTRPAHRADPPPPSGSLAAFAANDGATLVPQLPYVALERPELFADEDHLNRTGAYRFSAMLGRDVASAIAASRPSSVRAGAALGAPHVAFAGLTGLHARFGFGSPLRFVSFEFAVFFTLVVALYYAVRNVRARRALLLAASWYFYARWNASYLAVLLGLTVTDYLFGLGIERTTGVPRRAMLAAGITANVAFLASIKYVDFFTGSIAHVLGYTDDPWALHLLVPIGISFHTFQSISYLVDVSRGKTRAVTNFFDYALYIAFFPQLLAGPIVRAGTFFGELFAQPEVPERFTRGIYQIVLGLLKKSAIADRFAPAADAYFGSIVTHPGAAAAWSGAFAFAMQIYFDFSGYSDIAIGCARVLGFEFPENFHRPYLAWSVTEFWRRWHMTLSAWLRDYLYIPFGGNRHGRYATYRNLMLTMLIGGLWHGANWTFVAWGAYHGVALAVERALGIGRSRESAPPNGLRRVAATIATFLIVLIGWVFFRAQTFPDAFATIGAMFAGGGGPAVLDVSALIFAALVLGVEVADENGAAGALASNAVARGALTAALLLGLELGSYPGPAAEFVYFKF